MSKDKYSSMYVHPRLRDIQIIDGHDWSARRLLELAGYVESAHPEKTIDEYWDNALKDLPEEDK